MNEIKKRIAMSTLSYKDFSLLCGVCSQTIKKFERGEFIEERTKNKILKKSAHIVELKTFENIKDLGKFIKQKRLLKNIERKEFAKMLNVSLPTLDAIEKGEKFVKLDTYINIEKELDIEIFEKVYNLKKNHQL